MARAATWAYLAAALSLGPAAAIAADGPAPEFRVRITASATQRAVLDTIQGAHRRLERPTCQKLFTDFHDAQGRPLQDKLDGLGLSGPRYLEFLGFYSGLGQPRCGTRRVLAFTQPDSLAVHVCPQLLDYRGEWAELVVLHEMLHSLGLGENPPTSGEITDRVRERCGGR